MTASSVRARNRLRGAVLACAFLLVAPACAAYRAAKLYESGTDALDRGEVEHAIADLESAAALVGHASEIQNHLGLAYTEAGRRDAALAAFRRAVELDCGNAAAQHNLRAALARRGPVSAVGPRLDAPEGEGR